MVYGASKLRIAPPWIYRKLFWAGALAAQPFSVVLYARFSFLYSGCSGWCQYKKKIVLFLSLIHWIYYYYIRRNICDNDTVFIFLGGSRCAHFLWWSNWEPVAWECLKKICPIPVGLPVAPGIIANFSPRPQKQPAFRSGMKNFDHHRNCTHTYESHFIRVNKLCFKIKSDDRTHKNGAALFTKISKLRSVVADNCPQDWMAWKWVAKSLWVGLQRTKLSLFRGMILFLCYLHIEPKLINFWWKGTIHWCQAMRFELFIGEGWLGSIIGFWLKM